MLKACWLARQVMMRIWIGITLGGGSYVRSMYVLVSLLYIIITSLYCVRGADVRDLGKLLEM